MYPYECLVVMPLAKGEGKMMMKLYVEEGHSFWKTYEICDTRWASVAEQI